MARNDIENSDRLMIDILWPSSELSYIAKKLFAKFSRILQIFKKMYQNLPNFQNLKNSSFGKWLFYSLILGF